MPTAIYSTVGNTLSMEKYLIQLHFKTNTNYPFKVTPLLRNLLTLNLKVPLNITEAKSSALNTVKLDSEVTLHQGAGSVTISVLFPQTGATT